MCLWNSAHHEMIMQGAQKAKPCFLHIEQQYNHSLEDNKSYIIWQLVLTSLQNHIEEKILILNNPPTFFLFHIGDRQKNWIRDDLFRVILVIIILSLHFTDLFKGYPRPWFTRSWIRNEMLFNMKRMKEIIINATCMAENSNHCWKKWKMDKQ